MLAPHEQHIIDALREFPEERRMPMARACAELLRITAHHAMCTGIGPDGFPCGEPGDTCENCHALVHAFESLAH